MAGRRGVRSRVAQLEKRDKPAPPPPDSVISPPDKARNGRGASHAAAVAGAPQDETAPEAYAGPVEPAGDATVIHPDLTEALLERVCHAYDLGDYLGCQSAGQCPEGFRAALSTSRGEFILRSVARPDYTPLGLNVLLGILGYLRQRQYPAPNVMRTQAGAPFLTAGDRYYWTSVAPSLGNSYNGLDRQHLAAAAQGLAALHNLLRAYPGPHRLGRDPYLVKRVADALGRLDKPDADASEDGAYPAWVRRELTESLPALRALYDAEAPITTHGCFEPSALLLDSLGLAEVDNFERTGFDLRLVDLAHALEAFCLAPDRSNGNGRSANSAADDFLDAYEEISPLSEIEQRALPAVLKARAALKVLKRKTQRPEGREDRPRSPGGPIADGHKQGP